MTYTYKGFANASTLGRTLQTRAASLNEAVAELEDARQEAVAALAGQIRAQEVATADRDLVRAATKRQRDLRVG